jgi:2,5-diketo-D-gluconate reductase B
MTVNEIRAGHGIPLIGLGTWKLKGAECESIVRMALEMGYRHIDTADVYQNHVDIARAIRSYARHTLWLTSKIYLNDLQPARLQETSLRFLQELSTDYLDLLLIHWPDPNMDLRALVEAMVTVREKGWARHIGISNFSATHYEQLQKWGLLHEIYNHQLEMHPYLQRRKLYTLSQKAKIQLTAYRPLAKGAFEEDELMQEIGFRYGKSPSQIALNWLVAKGVSVIPKASSLAHLRENLESFDFEMTQADFYQIEKLERAQRFCQPVGLMQFEKE